MTAIYTTIRRDFVQSRVKKNGMAAFYSTLIGEMDNEASRSKSGEKQVTDDIAVKVLKTFKKNLEELKKSGGDLAKVTSELSVVDIYLPQQFTKDELYRIIQNAAESGVEPDMKNLMTYLKTNYGGLFDGKVAADVVKEYLTSTVAFE